MIYPCKYQAYGCTESLNCDTIVGHRAKCRYRVQVCPAAKPDIGRFSWTGSYNDFKGHLKEDHLRKCDEYHGPKLYHFPLASFQYVFFFIFAYSEIFCSLCLQKDKILSAVLLYVGPTENASKFKYKFRFLIKMIQKVLQ